ncbi:class I tRNA ligase family protein [Escherichia coli]
MVSPGADDWRNESGASTDFAGFNISYDRLSLDAPAKRTASCQNLSLSPERNGFIKNHTIFSAVRSGKRHVLPDRFVKGTCPKCKSRSIRR